MKYSEIAPLDYIGRISRLAYGSFSGPVNVFTSQADEFETIFFIFVFAVAFISPKSESITWVSAVKRPSVEKRRYISRSKDKDRSSSLAENTRGIRDRMFEDRWLGSTSKEG